MFIELTDKNGHKTYVNFTHVRHFYKIEFADETSCTALHMTVGSPIAVRESISEVLKLIDKAEKSMRHINRTNY